MNLFDYVLLGMIVMAFPAYVFVLAKCASAGSMAGRRMFIRLRGRSGDGKK